MKWEDATAEHKRRVVEGVCRYVGLKTAQAGGGAFYAGGVLYDGTDEFLFGNLRIDHTPMPLSGTGSWSFEQNARFGFTSMSREKLFRAGSLDFSSLSALELQLAASGSLP